MPTLIATIGSASANSYLTHAEANAYFDERLPLNPPWVASGQEALVIMATRTLDALAQPFKTLVPGSPAYYRVRRQWTGSPATPTQRLAWPRVQMFDCVTGAQLDVPVSSVAVGNPATVTTATPHRLQNGQEVLLFDVTGSSAGVNGAQTATVVDETSFTIPIDVTTAGTGGKMTTIPQRLKEATAELAGALLKEDRILDNDVIMQGLESLKAGSVSLSFKKDFIQQVIPQAVYDLLCTGWLTDELYEPALRALFDVVSE
jgi:hypothetical protein